MNVFIAWDGDHIGRQVGRASLADDAEGLRRISQSIDHGNEIWKSWVESHGGNIVSMGGDEGRAEVPADYLDELPKIRDQYAGAVGSTVSVGIGNKLSEADRALVAAKLRGGDRIEFYTEEVQQIIEEARAKGEQTEEAKIADEYLNKAAPAMNTGAFAGPVRPSAATVDKPTPVQGDHSAAEVAAAEQSQSGVSPELTSAASDFASQFHDAARAQEQEDTQQAAAETKNLDDVKQKIVYALQLLKQQAPAMEQIKQAAPDAYQAMMALAGAVVQLSKQLTPQQPMTKSESLVKEEVVVKPSRMKGAMKDPRGLFVYRVQGPNKQGPYGYSDRPAAIPESAQAHYNMSPGETTSQGLSHHGLVLSAADMPDSVMGPNVQPGPGSDFAHEEFSDLPYAERRKLRFGFESPEHARVWFGPQNLDRMKQHGWELQRVPAQKIWRSKSGRQVVFLPHKEPAPQPNTTGIGIAPTAPAPKPAPKQQSLFGDIDKLGGEFDKSESEGAKCSACGGPYHEATGHRHSDKTRLCGACAKDYKDWVKGHTKRKWGKVAFYDHAAASIKGDETKINKAENPRDLMVNAVRGVLSRDLLKPSHKNALEQATGNSCTAGHCYAASEALHYMLGGKEAGWDPQVVHHEGGTHWYLKNRHSGRIIDPTSDQFATPVPYHLGRTQAWVRHPSMQEIPSKRAAYIIERVLSNGPMVGVHKMEKRELIPEEESEGESEHVESMEKMAIADIKAGRKVKAREPWVDAYNYTHVLSPEQQKAGYTISVERRHEDPAGLMAVLRNKKLKNVTHVGFLGARLPTNGVVEVKNAHINEEHRRKGLGIPMYEALYAHAKHKLGVKKVIGKEHSTSANALHTALSRKHGLNYQPHEDKVAEVPASELGKPFDNRYLGYSYALKNEMKTEKDPDDKYDAAADGDLEKSGLPMPGTTHGHHLNLPVGSNVGNKVKVQHSDGKKGWVQVGSGQIMSQDPSGHPISSRNPGGK